MTSCKLQTCPHKLCLFRLVSSFSKPHLTGLPAFPQEHCGHSFLFKHLSGCTFVTQRAHPSPPPPALQCVFHSNRFTTSIPKAATFSPWVIHLGYIYLPKAGISRGCWHKWLHSSRGSFPTHSVLRLFWGLLRPHRQLGLWDIHQSFRAVADKFVLIQASKQKILLQKLKGRKKNLPPCPPSTVKPEYQTCFKW